MQKLLYKLIVFTILVVLVSNSSLWWCDAKLIYTFYEELFKSPKIHCCTPVKYSKLQKLLYKLIVLTILVVLKCQSVKLISPVTLKSPTVFTFEQFSNFRGATSDPPRERRSSERPEVYRSSVELPNGNYVMSREISGSSRVAGEDRASARSVEYSRVRIHTRICVSGESLEQTHALARRSDRAWYGLLMTPPVALIAGRKHTRLEISSDVICSSDSKINCAVQRANYARRFTAFFPLSLE